MYRLSHSGKENANVLLICTIKFAAITGWHDSEIQAYVWDIADAILCKLFSFICFFLFCQSKWNFTPGYSNDAVTYDSLR